ncbi:MAG: hypothetical protein N2645_04375 [Clostridia bacterium]|nr:hypothetical protein [Clostridia bacterium]
MKFKFKIVSFIMLIVLVSTSVLNVFAVSGLEIPVVQNRDDLVSKDIQVIDPVYPTLRLVLGNWKFNERSGTTAADSSMYKADATLSGATWTAGISGTGLSFNGSSAYASVPNAPHLNYNTTQSFTLSAWVNIPATMQNKWQGVVTKGSWAVSSAWYGIWVSGDNKWVFGANGNNITGGSATSGWHYVAAVQDGEANTRTLYVDGKQVATGQASDGVSTADLYIGGAKSTTEYFKGGIDEVKLRNYATSQTTLKTEFDKYNPTKLAEWKFDEAAGTAVADSTGNGHSGTLYNGTYWAAGKSESCARYFNINYTYIPASTKFNFTKEESYTITGWVNVPYSANRWQGVITKGRDTGEWYGLWISGDNKWVFGGTGYDNIFGNTVNTGWHHIALVQDGPNNTRYLYVDGTLVGSGKSCDATASARMVIGGCDGANEYFNGRVDEVKVYNYKFTSSNVNSDKSIFDHKLNVQTYTQQPYNNLCWATTASMVSSFFLDDIADRKLDIAKDKYGTTDFNKPGSWGDMIYYIQKYTGKTGTQFSGTLSFARIQSNIDAGRPIPYTIWWTTGSIGHALVMRGYESYSISNYPYVDQYVQINDPWDGNLYIIDYEYLKSNSQYTWSGYATY